MKRKIAKVINQVKMEEKDYLDVLYWQAKSVSERLDEVARLRKNYYLPLNGYFPEKIAKVVTFRLQIPLPQ